MKNWKIVAIVAYVAAICFFIAYFLNRNTPMLVLGCAWVAIGGMFTARIKQQK